MAKLEVLTGTVGDAIADVRAGRLPRLWPVPMTPMEAAGLAVQLPRARGTDVCPVGVGLAPPKGAEPQLMRATAARTEDGQQPIPAGAVGMLGCMWRGVRDDQPVVRVWFFRANGAPLRFVDSYLSEYSGHRPAEPIPGWEVIRLEPIVDPLA